MVKKASDKEPKTKVGLNEYFFPEYKKIIYASSIEEANEQLELLLQAGERNK